MAETVIFASSAAATWIMPSMPDRILTGRSPQRFLRPSAAFSPEMAAIFGLNFLICFSRSSLLFPAARAMTEKRSGNFSTTESVDCPMEPVEPKREMFFNLS